MGLTVPQNGYLSLRRAVDIVGGAALLVAASPLLIAAALVVRVEGGPPVLFGHRRIGLHRRPFRCWKLRTMATDAEGRLENDPELREKYLANGFKLPSTLDPRVTPVGRWLRRTHVDELPQLFNVLNGTMSLVGPRPVVADELGEFGSDADSLVSIKPGVFGAWTALGRHRPGYPERARIELAYVRSRSLVTDLVILVRSVGAVLRGQAQ